MTSSKSDKVYAQSMEMFTGRRAPGYIKVLEERLGDLKALTQLVELESPVKD